MKRNVWGLMLATLLLPALAQGTQVTFKGYVHTSVGAATLTPAGDSLTVGNLGSSGNDGVSIAVPTSGGFHVEFNPVVLPANGALGVFALASGDTLSASRISIVGGQKVMEVAFKDVPGITAYRVEAYLAGALVRTADVPLSALPVTSRPVPDESNICIRCFFRRVSDWLDDHNASVVKSSVTYTTPDGHTYSYPTYGADYKFLTVGHIGNDPTAVSFDNVLVYPIGATSNSPRADQLVLLGTNHPGIVLKQETFLPTVPMAERSFWILAAAMCLAIGLAWLSVRRSREARRRSAQRLS